MGYGLLYMLRIIFLRRLVYFLDTLVAIDEGIITKTIFFVQS